jgi:hypothetical protein
MYTLLTGAKKNVGDFLIVEKGRELIKCHSQENEFLEFKRWMPLDSYLEEINTTKAIILCGGPGYKRDFYPNVFPLTKNINDIKIPIIPFALGWTGHPMGSPDKFSFNESSMFLLRHIHRNFEVTSCRDIITKEILRRHGFTNVIMTGCPVWYDTANIGKKFRQPNEIKRIVFTVPANRKLFRQGIQLMKRLKLLFPKAQFFCVFHRGIRWDSYTSIPSSIILMKFKKQAEKLGYEIVDAAYDTAKIGFYRICDLHVGYRVHGHIFFLSLRKPTFLLQEDGRGRGVSETLRLPDVSAWKKNASDEIINNIKKELDSGFNSFSKISTLLDEYYKNMVYFLKKLP